MRDPWFESDEGSEIGRLRDANLEKTLKDGPVTGRETRRVLRETVANVVQQRRHSADTIDKVVHAVRNALRNRGVDLKMNDTDLEVEVSRIEKELRRGDGDTHVSVDGTIEKQEFREAEQAETTAEERKENADETGNVRDEAPAQPEQGEAEPAGGEAARPVEAQPQGGEAPRQGAVEPAKTAEPAITIENLSPILKTASVALAENGGDPSDPGHKLKSATKEELLSEQKKILDALNNPDPQAFERFVDKMNRHACKMVEIQEFQNEWRRLHPEVDLESTPLALERKRQELEGDVEHAKEMLSVHPNSKHLKTKLQEAERKLAEFISEHQGKDIETGAETTEPAKTDAAEAPTEAPPAMKTERDFLRVMHDNQEPVRVSVGDVSLPDTQFKEGADPKTGVVKGQELKGEYFESAENAVVVYVRRDGTKELVTGRHRFDLAKRTGKKDILARLFYEKDGYTPDDMRNLDAISNIIDEKGSVKDYVRYFENAKPSRAAAESAGFLSRSKGRLAFELYEGATEGTRAAIDWSGSGADGLISPEQAGIIAKAAPRDAHPRNGAVQRILVRKAQDGLRGDRLAIVARSLAEEAKRRKAPAADGETQLDLFTSEEDLALEEKRAAKRVEKANEYGRVASVLQTAMQKVGRLDLNKAYARELGIKNPKDRKQLADARQKALEKADYWRNAVRLDEADKAALDAELGIAPKENLELESVTGDQIAEENRKRAEAAGVKPPPQTRGNGPASAPEEAGTTTPPRAAKPAGGRKSGDAAVPKENLTAETPAKPVDGDETSATPKPLDGYLAGKKPIEAHRIPQSAAKAKPPAAEKPENTTGGGSAADAGRDARKVVGTDYTVARARELLREDVEARIADAAEELGADLRVVGVDLHGSRVRGDARPDSDLDLVVEYEGDAREDDLFDALNADPIDFHGIRVDVNPIRADKTGTLAEYMARSDGYDREKLAAKPAAPKPKAKAPSVRRGERVLLKGTTEGQRVTFLKDNGDGTADVQVKTSGANRYMPEKAETRTVKIGDIGSSNIKDTLTEEENAALRQGIEKQSHAPSVRMKDEAAEKLARQQEDDLAALFDTPEFGIMGGDEGKDGHRQNAEPGKVHEHRPRGRPSGLVDEVFHPFSDFLSSHHGVEVDRRNGTPVGIGVV